MRKIGNELFDIFWQLYPPRINGAGVMEKKRKRDALKWFEKNNPSEEAVYDMVAWIKKDIANREKSEAAHSFYSPPADAIVFLNQEKWIYDEIGKTLTKTGRFEKKRSRSIAVNNLKSDITTWESVICEWPVSQLKANKHFLHASRNPQFKAWAIEKRPELVEKTDPFKKRFREVKEFQKNKLTNLI